MPDVPAVRQPTQLTRVDVTSGPGTDELPAVERALLDDLGRALKDSALVFSCYLAEAGGVPARHSFLWIFVAAPNNPEWIEPEQCLASCEFEAIETPGDLSVLALQGRERGQDPFETRRRPYASRSTGLNASYAGTDTWFGRRQTRSVGLAMKQALPVSASRQCRARLGHNSVPSK